MNLDLKSVALMFNAVVNNVVIVVNYQCQIILNLVSELNFSKHL